MNINSLAGKRCLFDAKWVIFCFDTSGKLMLLPEEVYNKAISTKKKSKKNEQTN